MNFVLDASVALKWYYQESDSPQAKVLYDFVNDGRHLAVVPFLIYMEITNVLIARHKVAQAIVQNVLADLHNLPFETVPYSYALAQQAINIATENSLTVYDAIYLALAKTAGIKLLTADNQLIKAQPKLCIAITDLV